jgi:hypothetical protein
MPPVPIFTATRKIKHLEYDEKKATIFWMTFLKFTGSKEDWSGMESAILLLPCWDSYYQQVICIFSIISGYLFSAI